MLSDPLFRLRALFRRSRVERDLDEELRFHLEHQVEKFVRRGLDGSEAARRARLTFGGLEQLKEDCRDARGVSFIETLLQDSRYGLRMMRRYPAFTALAVLLIGLGIGASTSMFSLVTASVLWRSPFSDRLVYLWRYDETQREFHARLPVSVLQFRNQCRSLDRLAAYRYEEFLINGPNGPGRAPGHYVTANLLEALGVKVARGRNFLPEEEHPDRADVVILTDALWKRMFDGAAALGSRIDIQGRRLTVVGILPSSFQFEGTELFVPMAPAEEPAAATARFLADRRPGTSAARAQSEIDAIVAGLTRYDPANWKGRGVRLLTPDAQWSYDCGPTCAQKHQGIWLLFGAVCLVMLMACANVANLLLARSLGRAREFAIRTAIGCTRWRLVRQNLTESLVLFVCGGALGVLLAWWSLALLTSVAARYIETPAIHLDSRVFAFSALATVFSGLGFGLIPALKSAGRRHDGNRLSSVSVRRSLARRVLVTAEFTLALVLLVGFGLLLRSFLYVESIPTGLRTDRLLTTGTTLKRPTFKDSTARVAFARRIEEAVREIRGVESAALTSSLPLTGADATNIQVEGIASADPQGTEVRYISASPELFSTLGIAILEGRALSTRDTETAAPVVVINKTMAQMFFPNEDAIGRRIRMGEGPPAWREIVGVVADIRQRNLEEDSRPVFYRPYAQGLDEDLNIAVRVRSRADMPLVAESLRDSLSKLDSKQPWDRVQSMEQIIYDSESLSLRRPVVRLLAAFGLLAIILATMGLYAVLAYSVAERTREIGIRMALGANRRQVVGEIGSGTLRLIAPGALIGMASAYALSALLPSGHIGWTGSGVFLYRISRLDAVTYAAVVAALGSVSLLAAFIPARRAMRVDPAASLRHE